MFCRGAIVFNERGHFLNQGPVAAEGRWCGRPVAGALLNTICSEADVTYWVYNLILLIFNNL